MDVQESLNLLPLGNAPPDVTVDQHKVRRGEDRSKKRSKEEGDDCDEYNGVQAETLDAWRCRNLDLHSKLAV